jgi:hypothetical protein
MAAKNPTPAASALVFTKDKETKNTIRYTRQEEGENVSGSIYVQKSALPATVPSTITVTVNI